MTALRRAIVLMRDAQQELDRGGHVAIAAHLETALGFAAAQLHREPEQVRASSRH